VIAPEGAQHIAEFSADPWPRWIYHTNDGTRVEQEICAGRDLEATVVKWRLLTHRAGVKLIVRPFLSGRDYHSLHHENPAFRFDATTDGDRVKWHPYASLPEIVAMSNGNYKHEPLWYRNFLYTEERARGLDDTEDLAAPGVFEWDLSAGDAVMLLTTDDSEALVRKRDLSAAKFAETILANEKMRRAEFPSRLHRSADAYIVNGWHGKTIVAGYPWFTDWGRDTFIALRGLCLATDRLDDAKGILLSWTKSVSEGMLPNRFPDAGQQPEYNSVDASLWFIIAAHELIEASGGNTAILSAKDKRALQNAIEQILEGYARGTRFGIKLDDDGLLACGVPGVQLTWMDAKVGDWVVTPRRGKAVEINALWYNALRVMEGWIREMRSDTDSTQYADLANRVYDSFNKRFWYDDGGYLLDVIDGEAGDDISLRPNQLFAFSLPNPVLEPLRWKKVLDTVQQHLVTPYGLRSLAPGSRDYKSQYYGDLRSRDAAYHQGTVWAWLIGPFIDAWLRVYPDDFDGARRFLEGFKIHLGDACVGSISEVFDATEPFIPRGCVAQAWSVAEVLRCWVRTAKKQGPGP
jgi:predicted glycogen debranching enzyme